MFLIYFFIFLKFVIIDTIHVTENTRPIIGILTKESNEYLLSRRSYIMAFDVKFVEAGGARVIPIRIYQSKKYYQDILSKINGILLPGGADLLDSDGYGRTSKLIFDLAVKMNDQGDYFPIWGTCLGFEMLNYAAVKKLWMKLCAANDLVTNVELVKGFNNSRMFSDLNNRMQNIMLKEKVAIHLHHWCLTPENYTKSGLDKFYKVLALNKDLRNETFVSVIEAYNYPFFGVAFHPEIVLFDWEPFNVSTPHSSQAVEVSQFLSRFFVKEARKNFHYFPSKTEEISELIYNYNPKIVGDDLSSQMYIFDD